MFTDNLILLFQDKVSGDLSIEDLFFTYPARPDVQVIKGINLSVKAGQTLALVGPSGCGKSTVVQLIERFYNPSKGGLKLEGIDLRDLNISWLRSQIGIVSQEPVLFDGTIAENIRYGALFREVSDEEVIAAAKSANIHSFIETLPMVSKVTAYHFCIDSSIPANKKHCFTLLLLALP